MNPAKPLLLAALIGFSDYNNAAQDSSALQNIRQAISEAQTDLKQKQAAQARAKQTLANSQTALTKAQHELESLNRRQSATWNNLQKLQAELEQTKTDISSTKAQVARLLESHYKNRQQNAVVLFLKNAEPGQKARYLEYARYINQSNEKAIKDLIAQQQQLAGREKAVDAELARLKRLRTQKQAAINRLNKTHSNALQQSQALNSQIDQQNRRIAALRSDEARLNAILANIARRNAAAKKAQTPAKRQQAEAKLAQQRNNTKPNPSDNGVRSTLTAEDRSLQGSDQSNNRGLGKLQGSLRRPVGGSISGRFGQARPGGGTWRGVFFATPPAGVHSIAAGTVAYAGSLGGYGNTVVVDHGSGYVSVYTGLGSINVGGGTVGSGSVLGTSGSLPGGEQGLYFEIRYRNQPMNPLSWVR